MNDQRNRQLVLRQRPAGAILSSTFETRTTNLPALAEGEFLVKVEWLGIDATQRTWLNPDFTYVEPVEIGAVMPGSGVGKVVATRHRDFRVGQSVYGMLGWQEYAVACSGGVYGVNPVPEGIEPRRLLTVFGVSGLTAYMGMSKVLRVDEGDSVLVTGAAGSVGSLAGQVAKQRGARVLGTAGTAAKVGWVKEVAGFDCVNYHGDIPAALRSFAPDGFNAVFDNVGGALLENALDNLALRARIALCGSISSGYTASGYGAGPANYMQLAFKRATMEGFVFLDYVEHFPEALAALSGWADAGQLRWAQDVVDGLDRAPEALQGLFEGTNLGKRLVRVATSE